MKRVMVVDDSPLVRASLRAAFEGLGCEVFAASSPFGATNLVARLAPDLLIVDLDMPAFSGDALVQCIRSTGSLKQPTIVLHSDATPERLELTRKACGADAAIRKGPLDKVVPHLVRLMGWS